MTKNQKVEIVKNITEEFKASAAVVVCDFRGIDVPAIEELRIDAKEMNVKVRVIKNTLASIAMKNADIEGIDLTNTNIFVWGEDQLDVTKVVAKFAKANDKFVIKTAFIDGEVSDAAKVEALSKMPSRDELIGMLLQTWMAPVTNFTIGLDALRAQKEEESA
ncbi:MAG TPA: 50S ribosomal protein L10 [Sulfurospirillum arcachonense]|nr:50S ribosomal protein L10 [Sulfurospirillum arcachonense]HIP45699.1 50S ribosomal protein L10 [Sulfurospirillum arcachonense]